MLKNFRANKSDTVKQYEKAAKTSSNLIAAPTAPVTDKLPFSSFFGSGNEDKKPEASSSDTPKASFSAPSFSAPKVDVPKFDTPKIPDMPSFSAPKFELPKMPDMPKVPDLPKMPDVPKFEAPSLPLAPAVPAEPKPITPPVLKASEPPVVVKQYVPSPPPAPVVPTTPAAPAPTPVPTPAPTAASSQGDFMDRWQRDQTKSGSAPKALSSTPQKKAVVKKEAPKQVARSGKRQGPLPLWLAEFIMLGVLTGFGAAVVLFQDSLKELYVSADKAIAGATANFNKKGD